METITPTAAEASPPKPRRTSVITPGVDAFAIGMSDGASFLKRFFVEALWRPFHVREIIKQCYEVGYRSLPLITLTGFVTGIVFTKQSRPSLIVKSLANLLRCRVNRHVSSEQPALDAAFESVQYTQSPQPISAPPSRGWSPSSCAPSSQAPTRCPTRTAGGGRRMCTSRCSAGYGCRGS